ncbi:MAG: hypothetical protein HYV27_15800 [Candidatus Hydrogenedentes bacterium]|nr:hypothetical protein [Candidatus Hydrogenedentota bacterium]
MSKGRLVPWVALFGLVWACGVTLYRALRWPNDWAEAHWLITYEFGFIKRGLAGTLLNLAVPEARLQTAILSVSVFFLAALALALVWAGFRLCSRAQWRPAMVFTVAVFLTSPYIVMSAHLIGYYDHIVILIALFACWCVLRAQPELAALLLAAGVLVHENILVIGLPCVLFAVVLRIAPPLRGVPAPPAAWRTLARYTLVAAAPIAVFLAIFIYQHYYVDNAALRPTLRAHILEYPFVQWSRHNTVSKAFTTSFFFYLKTQSPHIWERLFSLENSVQNGVTLLFLWAALAQGLRGRAYFWPLLLFGLVLSLLPLSFHLIAWDTSRFWTLPAVAAFMAVWAAWESRAGEAVSSRSEQIIAALALMGVVFNALIRTLLMDLETERLSDAGRILAYAPACLAFAYVMTRHSASGPARANGE